MKTPTLNYEPKPTPERPRFSPLRVILVVMIVVASVYVCLYWAFLLQSKLLRR